MNDPLPRDRNGLIEAARYAIYHGDLVLEEAANSAYPKEQGPWGSIARAHYARAATLIQLAGYLGMTEEAEGRKAAVSAFIDTERQRQDDYIAGRELEARGLTPADLAEDVP